jgi:cysteinyl-tRNA synthetase
MGEILLHNTLTNRKEPFVPLHPGEVRMYTCGPTVYDYAHIGNFRTFVFQDVLRRFFRSRGYQMKQAMNLTDVDDRIIQNAAAAGVSIRAYTEKYVAAFLEDIQALNIETPEYVVRATDHIPDMVTLIEALQKKGMTYGGEGSIYYSIARFPEYGKLSKIDVSGIRAGARVDVDLYEKADARDFALWKAPKPGEFFWETAIGPGRPGWHIECAAMAMKYLGETIDIHTGGVDLMFPHHENEIAESEAATGKPFVRTWMHAEHLLVDGEKMSKSVGNFYTLRDLFSRGFKPSTVRFLLLSVPYRRQFNFTMEGLKQASSSVERMRNLITRLRTEKFPAGQNPEIEKRTALGLENFEKGLEDDLNTSVALAAVFDLLREVNTSIDRGQFHQGDVAGILEATLKFDAILALLSTDDDEKLRHLGFGAGIAELSEEAIAGLIEARETARKRRDFKKADEVRQQLAEGGIIVEDIRGGGVRWKRK